MRGFVGEFDIDNYTVSLDEVDHDVVHGGGNWRMARTEWPEHEWNTRVRFELRVLERDLGRDASVEEILELIEDLRVDFGIDGLEYEKYRGKK